MMKLSDAIKEKLSIDCYDTATIERVTYYKENNKVNIVLNNESYIPFLDYQEIKRFFEKEMELPVSLSLQYVDKSIPLQEMKQYFDNLIRNNLSLSYFSNAILTMDKQMIFVQFNSEDEMHKAEEFLEQLVSALKQFGIEGYSFHTGCIEEVKPIVEEIYIQEKEEVKKEAPVPTQKYKYRRVKKEDYAVVELKDITEQMSMIQFTGEVFGIEEKEIKDGRILQTFNVFDGTEAFPCKRFENERTLPLEVLREINNGDYVKIYGDIKLESFRDESGLVCFPRDVEKLEKKTIIDEAKEKRVEFHMHSNMSEMDGVVDIRKIVQFYWDLGHEGFVLTDHNDVQSFVKGYNAIKGLKKSDPDREFKMGLGCEMNLCDDKLTIVRNPNDESVDECEYICFDLETTGLSAHFDSIIEFGAVKIKNHSVVDRKQLFIKPRHEIPAFITSKTNITNDMVKDAPSFQEVYQEIVDWIGDAVLVAHNATFDYFFFNEELKRVGAKPLTNPVIDTLDMARSV
ncbi:MAG: PHP domain-containing protein, partial [Solobacterium sp.]|nr:PHP domain-containing protein [Solobacterium sp.]